MLVSHIDLNFTDLRFKGGNNSCKSMTTRRFHTQTKFNKHGTGMYDPDNVKCPNICSNLKQVLHRKVKDRDDKILSISSP